MFGVYQNPDLSDKSFEGLLTAMAKVKSFMFVGDVNAHHEEWIGSSTINVHGRAARDFTSSPGCEQMITKHTHIDGGVSDLVLTDVSDDIEVWGSSAVDHDALLEQPIPHLVRNHDVYLKNSVDWKLVREDVKGLNWNEISPLDIYAFFAPLDLYATPIGTIRLPHWTHTPPPLELYASPIERIRQPHWNYTLPPLNVYATPIERIRYLHWKCTPLAIIYGYSNKIF